MTNTDDKITHYEAVKALLPDRYRRGSQVSSFRLRVTGMLSVELEKSTNYLNRYDRLKIDVDYGIKQGLDNKYRNRVYKRRERDGAFNYQAAANYITTVLDAYAKLKNRRALGQTKAEQTGERLKSLFKADPLLQGIGMDIRSEPVINTLCGETRVAFVEESPHSADVMRTAFEFKTVDGENFSGQMDLNCLSPEQVIAIVTILRADKLSLLDMLHLADDSILGPIIRRLTKDQEEVA